MTKKYTWSKVYPISADDFLKIVTSEEFELQNMHSQPNNKEGTYTVVSRDDKKLVYRLDAIEWGKTMTGSIDKNKTEKSVTTKTWDLTIRRGDWVYRGPQERAKVWGTLKITPEGDNARISTEFNVDITIPLIGGKIGKIVISEVEKHWPRYVGILDEFVKNK